MKNEKFICCLCGRERERRGNDPWPLVPLFEASDGEAYPKCCDSCNAKKVIPARIERLREIYNGED